VQLEGVFMKVVIYQSKFCCSDNQLFNDYPILKEWENKGEYVGYDDYLSDDYKNINYNLYWRGNSLILDLNNDEIFKIIQQLTSYSELIIGYADKYDHESYGIDFHIEIYDDYRE
jgi:hypothetical protein